MGAVRGSTSVFIVAVTLLSACGPADKITAGDVTSLQTTPVSAPEVEGGAAWVRTNLDVAPSPDLPVQFGVDGDRVVAIMADDDGTVRGFVAEGDGPFVAGEPVETGVDYLYLGEPVPYDGGWLVVGAGGMDGPPQRRVLRSDDGGSWTVVDSGLPGGVIADVAGADGALVAVGGRRGSEVGGGGDVDGEGGGALAWRSVDASTWTEVALPARSSAEVAAIAGDGPLTVAVGTSDGGGAVWTSSDGGQAWSAVDDQTVAGLSVVLSVAVDGQRVVVSGLAGEGGNGARVRDGDGAAGSVLVASHDGGASWRQIDQPPYGLQREGEAYEISAGGGRFLTTDRVYVEAWREPEVCYADVDRCRAGATAVLYASDDAATWQRIDTSQIREAGSPYGLHIEAVAASATGDVLVMRGSTGDVEMWRWPGGVELPAEPEPILPTSDVELLGEREPQIGRRYGVPLYTHCGMDWLYVAGEPWQRSDDGPDLETGGGDQVPEGWPVAQETIFGFATLVASDRIEYSIGDGEVIATYAPTDREPPLCA